MIIQQPGRAPTPAQREQIARKFGMFLHFGINTFGNVEWSDGTFPVSLYAPSGIDADQWVRTAFEAGMNYVVVITKHHDGFSMFDTKYTDYGVMHSSMPVDVVAEVSRACKKYGVKLGLYYSLWDRHEPCYADHEAYVQYMLGQLTELMDGRYGEVVELWLDGVWDKKPSQWGLDRVYDLVKRLQPGCQIGVNHTVGVYDDLARQPEERYLPKNYQEMDPLRVFPSDFRLWDPHMCRADDPKLYTFGGEVYYMPFEMTICSRQGFSWFYSNHYDNEPFIDVAEIVANYRTLVAADNLLVINMPPDIHGRLVQADIDHLMAVSQELGIARV